MCHLKRHSKLTLFADDTTISSFGKDSTEIISKLELDLNLIVEWLSYNRLVINVTKSKAMFFSHYIRKSNEQKLLINSLKIKCNNEDIDFTKEIKVLGVTIDNELKFNSQIDNICKKVNSKTFLLRKSLYLFTDNFKPILFKLFIQPNFDYCSTLLMHISTITQRDKLNSCFIKSVKRLLKLKKLTINTPIENQKIILEPYNILPLFYRQFFRYCTFVFNVLKNKNLFLNTCLKDKTDRKTRSDFIIPVFKTNFKKLSFSVIAFAILQLLHSA